MKVKLLLLNVLMCYLGFSQSITVSTTQHTVPELVTNVLLNSPCLSVNNINWRTGTNFGSSNGIGYFTNTNPNFPISSGVILSTGDVANAASQNTTALNDGNENWTGDADLENILRAAGINMSSTNATVLEFEFMSLSSHFDFDFLFASEEYGNFQCQFSDAFAFVLTNLNTNESRNLAVVPGTNSPISVVTIRDYLYNSQCPSMNEAYFGRFNGGANASQSAINFNGQTVVMNASAQLIPNTPYKIKLVIADRDDHQSDSAIFISANSFNIGQQVLGPDLTLTSQNAPCPGETRIIDSGLPANEYTFQWKKDNVIIPGETSPQLGVTTPGLYELTYTNIQFPCQQITDTIQIEFFREMNVQQPADLIRCTTGEATYTFNLATNTPRLLSGLATGSSVSYHVSEADAINNVNALSSSYNSAPNRTIYARINRANSNCYTIRTFQLLVQEFENFELPNELFACQMNNGTQGIFYHNSIVEAFESHSYSANYTLTIHLSQQNAINNTGNISWGFNQANNGSSLYAKVQSSADSSCFEIFQIRLNVLPKPEVDRLENVIVCEDYILPQLTNGSYFTGTNGSGTELFPGDRIDNSSTLYIYNSVEDSDGNICASQSNFNITILDPEQLDFGAGTYCNQYVLPAMDFGKYFTESAGQGTELNAGNVITSSQTIHYYYETTTEPFCIIDLSFDIEIISQPSVTQFQDVFRCFQYTLPQLEVGKYYDTPYSPTSNEILPGTVITETQTIYIHANNGNCTSQSQFTVHIGLDIPEDIVQCGRYILPNLPIGNYYTEPGGQGTRLNAGSYITSSRTIYLHVPTTDDPNCSDNWSFRIEIMMEVPEVPKGEVVACDRYILPELNVGNYYTGPDGTGTIIPAGTAILNDQTIYAYYRNEEGCSDSSSFDVRILPLPQIDSRSNIDICNSYTLTDLANGNYYTGPNGTGNILHGGEVITETQTIYIFNTNGSCDAETSFTINIYPILADQLEDITVCDSFVLPELTAGNYYYTAENGPYGFGEQIAPGTIITESQTIYIYKWEEIRPAFTCSDESTFNITIIETPFVAPIDNVYTCDHYILPELTVGDYYTAPNKGGERLNAGTIITENITLYVYAAAEISNLCNSEVSFEINIYNVDELDDVIVCEEFVLPELTNGSYDVGVNGEIMHPGYVITETTTVQIRGNAPWDPTCTDKSSFQVTIVPRPVIHTIPFAQRTFCDEDGVNDGIMNIDLNLFDSAILGTQAGEEFVITYHETLQDAQTNSNPINSTTLNTIYIRLANTLTDACAVTNTLNLTVNQIPEPTLEDGIICIDSISEEILSTYTINSGLSASTHTFEWYHESTLIPSQNGSSLTVSQGGTYFVIATNRSTGCSSEPTPATIHISEPPRVRLELSPAFHSDQTITVIAEGRGGAFEYQLNDGPFQDSPIFMDVPTGIHNVTVRDLFGCGSTTEEVLIINYPKYFTPNADGYNDVWNIEDLQNQPQAIIYIYDRYGKLMSQIKPSGNGWDGTLNGQPMPSTDYWFTVDFEDQGHRREFKAHFSLKR